MAALAGVGRGTVSRVINNAAGVKDTTRRAVQRAIAELGYVPNLAARTLAGRRADAVALVMTEPDWRQFGEPFFSEIVRSVGDALTETEVQLLLTLVRTDAERQRLVEYARGGRVDGVMLMSVHATDPLPDMLAEVGLPTVLLGRRSGDESVTYVDADNVGGARAAVSHLLGTGAGARSRPSRGRRTCTWPSLKRGYREALERARRRGAGVLDRPGRLLGGQRAPGDGRAHRAGAGDRRGVRRVGHDGRGRAGSAPGGGRRVPDDVAVIGFDDFPLAQHTDPKLTTVRQPLEEIGHTMVRLLLEEMEEPSAAWRHVIHRTELVLRGSA